MNMTELLISAAQGELIPTLAKQFNLQENETENVVQNLAPALARGIKTKNVEEHQQQQLWQALQKDNHQQYVDNPKCLCREESVQDGNKILGHIFGDKRVSRGVAALASQNTGVETSIIKKMLPMLAAAAMGALSKQAGMNGAGGTAANDFSVGGITTLLTQFLDTDNDGSFLDDLIDKVG